MSQKRVYLDTNCVLRAIVRDIPEQTKAVQQLLSECVSVVISPVCLMECVHVLRRHYQLDRKTIRDGLVAFLSLEQISGHLSIYKDALESWTLHPRLSFEDCFLAESAASDGAMLYTFDQHLARDHDSAALVDVSK